MIKRRTVLGAGIAFASLTGAAGPAAFGASVQRRRDLPSIDALLVDDTVDMPRHVIALIAARGGAVPVISAHLDPAAYAGLRRVFNSSNVIAGISSGATLFCLERIAWDHGFRLTARSEYCFGGIEGDANGQLLAAFVSGGYASAESPSALDRAYRPSRADGMLHAWIMQIRGPNLHRHREVGV